MNLVKRFLTFCLIIFAAFALQSQQSVKSKPDSSNSNDSLPIVIKDEASFTVDSTEILKQKLEEEVNKTAQTSERIMKKVDRIPNLFNRAINTVVNANRVRFDAEMINTELENPLYPIIRTDSILKKKPTNKFLWFKRKQ